MKKIIPVLFCLFNLIVLNGQYPFNNHILGVKNLNKENINGDVKLLIESDYKIEMKFGEINDSVLEKKVTYHYNKKRNQILEVINTLIGWGDMEVTWSCKYNESNKRIEENIFWREDELYSKVKYKYNEKGLTSEICYYENSGILSKKILFSYDINGNKIEEDLYYSEDLYSENTYRYDSKKRIVEKREITKGLVSFENTWIYKYDDKSRIILEEQYFKLIGNTLIKTIKYKFDENGNLVEKIEIEKNEKMEKIHKYVYSEIDNNKNWHFRTEFLNNEIVKITKREIEYY